MHVKACVFYVEARGNGKVSRGTDQLNPLDNTLTVPGSLVIVLICQLIFGTNCEYIYIYIYIYI